ncbi:MAG: class I SAM-dependent methyltransferase [Fibromonadaceae bacterium]|jgi:2-polyprenyl-3-methyl-5-hydroxy-6-metoxy-1,4-benzoquinol methylase|nr:class I SAM-dependent methyltransferase [Fibromonadaceae bacterium]
MTHCRFCSKELKYTFADLGLSPLSNEYVSESNLVRSQCYNPLVVKVCDNCFLAQALDFIKPEEIFSDYKYFSSFSTSWLKHCEAYVSMIIEKLSLDKNSLVTEIACNDGYLLQYFKPHGIQVYGVEPAETVALEARKKGIDVEVTFFEKKCALGLVEKRGKSNLIIGNNVFAHVPDINSFVDGLSILLAPNGTITLEFPHILKLIGYNQFDTIYHEHFSYFSIIAVNKIFEAHNLKIINIEELETHGGSVRIYVVHKDSEVLIDKSVEQILANERNAALDKIETYLTFNKQIQKIKFDSLKFLIEAKEQKKSIAAYGAAAKGNTFLNYCGIGKDFIDYVVDANIHKQGNFLPGTHIPIVGKDELLKSKPDYVIILPWNLKSEIIEAISFIRDWNGKFVTFIPNLEVR